MKRFTETAKWDDVWFRSLPGIHKLIFLYIIDRCNNAGFWEEDLGAMAFHTKLNEKHFEGAWEGLSRGLVRMDGWAWVKNFLRHQKNEDLNWENTAHRQIIRMLADQVERFGSSPCFRAFIDPYKGLLSPSGKGNGKGEKEESTRETKRRGSREELLEYCRELGLPDSDAEWLFDKWEGTGWKNDGKPIGSWKATASAWKRAAIFPSLKVNGHKKPSKMFLTE